MAREGDSSLFNWIFDDEGGWMLLFCTIMRLWVMELMTRCLGGYTYTSKHRPRTRLFFSSDWISGHIYTWMFGIGMG